MVDGKKSIQLALILIIFFLPLRWLGAQEGSSPSPEVEIYQVNFDSSLVNSGYTVASPNNDFRLGIFPQVLSAPTDFVLKKRTAVPYVLPEGKTVVSDFWEFDIVNKKAYDGQRPIVVQLQYRSNSFLKQVVFWNGQDWQELPSQIIDAKNRLIRVYFHLPYARFVVLADSQLMSEGQASWYRYKACDCAASPDYPKGTVLNVTNIDNNKTVKVKVNDFGPERDLHPQRVIDLDVVAFKKLGSKYDGLINVLVEPENKKI